MLGSQGELLLNLIFYLVIFISYLGFLTEGRGKEVAVLIPRVIRGWL